MNVFPFPEIEVELVAKENGWECVQRIELDENKVVNLLVEGEKIAKMPIKEDEPPIGI